jgi:hypothetical protein
MNRSADQDLLESRLVWIFGSPRSGSTWLMNLIGLHPHAGSINEPLVGINVAPFMSESLSRDPLRYRDALGDRPELFFSDQYAATWRPLLRKLILGRFAVHGDSQVMVVKDPNGSQGADVIMSTLPRSRFIFLLRDGRDVVDSEVASLQPRAWRGREFDVTATRNELIEFAARNWLARTEIVERAFADHDKTLRLMVRYEDLLDDPEGWLTRIYDWCGLEASADQVRATVAAFAVDTVAVRTAETFVRTATPGLWRENFDEAERALLTGILDQKLRQLGYETG